MHFKITRGSGKLPLAKRRILKRKRLKLSDSCENAVQLLLPSHMCSQQFLSSFRIVSGAEKTSKNILKRYHYLFNFYFINISRGKLVVAAREKKVGRVCSRPDYTSLKLLFFIAVKLRENRGKEQTNMTVLTDNIFKQEEADTMREEWRMAAIIINRLFAWIYVFTIIVTLLAVLLTSPRFRNGEL